MNNQFYPTPVELLEKITEGCNWKRIKTVLEPSAGKGDIVAFLQGKAETNYMDEYDIDCIEVDPENQATLRGKGMRLVFDDFLQFHTRKRYDLIIMNPPFANGDEHLLKALELQENGGNIICILNAETIRNPFSVKRKSLVQKLNEYGADISYMQDAFADAERTTSVEIAVIKVSIPKKQVTSFIYENLKTAAKKKYHTVEDNISDLVVNDYLKAIVQRYEIEVDACLHFIQEYQGLRPYIMENVKENHYTKPILMLRFNEGEYTDNKLNEVIRAIRKKYWKALFADSRFTGKMTSKQKEDYMDQVEILKDYEFNIFNIKDIQVQMTKNLVSGIEECIMILFDKLSHEYSYLPETGRNIHYFNGWCTNKAHVINKKVIIPMHGVFSDIFKEFQYGHEICEKLSDIEKVFDYLAGIASGEQDNSLYNILNLAQKNQETKNIECKYFTLTFYKKGTCHITFKDEELLKKFNIFGSQHKGWLPPSYGKKAYEDMSEEEQAVVDSFEGKKAYDTMMLSPDKYLINLRNLVPRLEG